MPINVPHPNKDRQGFEDHCEEINGELLQMNHEETMHVFSLFLNNENNQVIDDLNHYLPDLRKFILRSMDEGISILRFEAGDLRRWLARSLYRIEVEKDKLTVLQLEKEQSDTDLNQETDMSDKDAKVNIVGDYTSVQIHSGNGDQTINNEIADLEKILSKILAETDSDKSGFRDLRGEVRKTEGEITDTGEVPKNIAQRFKPYLDLVDPAGKVVKLINSIITLCGG